jgi:hypothetical protein
MSVLRTTVTLAAVVFGIGHANAADTLSDKHKIYGHVPQLCFLPAAAPHDVDLVAKGAVSKTDGSAEATNLVSVEYINAMCNFKPIIGITSQNGGATRNGVLGTALPQPSAGLTNRIDYRVEATWGEMSAVLVTNGQPATTTARDTQVGRIGDVKVVINSVDGTAPVEAGYYEDILEITFGAED